MPDFNFLMNMTPDRTSGRLFIVSLVSIFVISMLLASIGPMHEFAEIEEALISGTINAQDIDQVIEEHRWMLIPPFVMVISGGILLGALFYQLARMRRINHEKKKMMGLLEPRMAAIENTTDGIFITDQKGDIKYINKSLISYHGYQQAEDVVGEPWHILYSAQEVDFFENKIIPDLLETGSWRGQIKGLRQDGSEFNQDMSVNMLADGGRVSVIRDSSAMMKYVEIAEHRLEAIESAGDGIALIDEQGMITYMNQALCNIYLPQDADHEALVGKKWQSLFPHETGAHIHDTIELHLKNKKKWYGETVIKHDGKTPINVEISIARVTENSEGRDIQDGQKRGMIVTVRDTSTRKQADREKDELQKQVFRAQKMEAIGRLAGGVAHDFNNILSSIMGYTDFLIEDLEDGEETQYFAQQILQGTIQARHLVEQILTFSRRGDEGRHDINLLDTMHETASMLRSTVPSTIDFTMDMNVKDAHINANPTQISQVVVNLCVNAVDAIYDRSQSPLDAHGQIHVSIDHVRGADVEYVPHYKQEQEHAENSLPIKFVPFGRSSEAEHILSVGEILEDQDYICICVADTGGGISREVMEHMFEPFFTTKSVDQGTGLGLSSVHGIIAGHKAAMTVRSTVGEGTVFKIYFPAVEAIAGEQKDVAGQDVLRGSGRILVVEDEDRVRDMLIRMLERLGYDVAYCTDGDEAVDELREKPDYYDLVLSDYTMPRMNGGKLAEIIDQDFPGLPVIILSGYSQKRLKEIQAENKVIKSVLSKPVDKATLFRHVEAALKLAGKRPAVLVDEQVDAA
jgi:PAS domain S-box-containing protein